MRIEASAHHWATRLSVMLLTISLASAITVKHSPVKSSSTNEDKSTQQKLSNRQGFHGEDVDNEGASSFDPTELIKRSQNVTQAKTPSSSGKFRQDSPSNIDEVRTGSEDIVSKPEYEDKNPRIYYDSNPGFPHGGHESHFENGIPEGKYERPKESKFYFPKHYMNSKLGHSKKGHKHHGGRPGKRTPDHVEFDEEHHHGHEYPAGHGHAHPEKHHHEGNSHPEKHVHEGQAHPEKHHHEGHSHPEGYHFEGHEHSEEHPFEHHLGDHHPHGKGPHHHVSGYGYNHHFGGYRHTIGDKVDAVGKALKVLIPSALLFTGVSALFPNRVHVPTTSENHRVKRSAFFRRRGVHRGAPLPEPVPVLLPEYEDIPSHILHAEHRIMEGSPADVYPEYAGLVASSENPGFDPFKVFKGPGSSEDAVRTMQDALPVPHFPVIPDIHDMHDKGAEFLGSFPDVSGEVVPPTVYTPGNGNGDVPPTELTPDGPTTQMSRRPPSSDESQDDESYGNKKPQKPRQNIIRRRKITRKPPVFFKETPKRAQHSSESIKSQYLVRDEPTNKNHIEDSNPETNVKAEREFMQSLKGLVTPDVAKAIFDNKQEPPKNVDMSPDGPVMGLLTSYAQHENDTPLCQKRALCELAVKGKAPSSTKFEAFLWSVATLVPDVFSEMYDLQEVFHAIRDERCTKFHCSNPNMDLQLK